MPDGGNIFKIIKNGLENAKRFLDPRNDYYIKRYIGSFSIIVQNHLTEVFDDKYKPPISIITNPTHCIKHQPLADAIKDHNWRVEVSMEKPREDVAYISFRYQGDASDALRYDVAKNALNTALNSTPSGHHKPDGIDGQKLHTGMYIYINNVKKHPHQAKIVETCRAMEEQQADIALSR